MPEQKSQSDLPLPAPEQEVKQALSRICNSDPFQNSNRQKAFLTYVVEETLAGRGKDIRGKTIAQDVYDRGSESDSDNIVRVDARRLRRKLDEYYRSDGAGAPVRIHIDGGGYAPRFEWIDVEHAPEDPGRRAWSRWSRPALVTALLGCLILVLILTRPWGPDTNTTSDSVADLSRGIERMALRDKSVSALEAANLDKLGRGHFFPIGDVARQKLATTLFQEVIQLDPTYFGGYASAAHSLATLSILTPDAKQSQALLSQSLKMRNTAVTLAPTDAWTQSAAAWSSFAQKDYDRAIEFSQRAHAMAPQDGNIADFYALIAILTGRFENAQHAVAPDRPKDTTETRLAYRNLYAVASFHLGQYQRAITSFDSAMREGGPVSEFTLLFMAASHQGAGHPQDAAKLVAEMKATWPNFHPDRVLKRFYQKPRDVAYVMELLKQAGWKPGA